MVERQPSAGLLMVVVGLVLVFLIGPAGELLLRLMGERPGAVWQAGVAWGGRGDVPPFPRWVVTLIYAVAWSWLLLAALVALRGYLVPRHRVGAFDGRGDGLGARRQ